MEDEVILVLDDIHVEFLSQVIGLLPPRGGDLQMQVVNVPRHGAVGVPVIHDFNR